MLISYLDRGNIGFAATQGMVDDINLKGSEFNVSLAAIFDHRSLTDEIVDGSIGVLRLLYPCRVPGFYTGQATTIQSSHTHDLLLLGRRLPWTRLRQIFWRLGHLQDLSGILRRLLVSFDDAFSREL
jgi:hypothetical protein